MRALLDLSPRLREQLRVVWFRLEGLTLEFDEGSGEPDIVCPLPRTSWRRVGPPGAGFRRRRRRREPRSARQHAEAQGDARVRSNTGLVHTPGPIRDRGAESAERLAGSLRSGFET